MTRVCHDHNSRHVADAHGRTIDFTAGGPAPMHACARTRPAAEPQPRGRRRGAVVVHVAAVLTGGLVVSVLLVVLRDIVTTLASTSATGLIVKALLVPSNRRDR